MHEKKMTLAGWVDWELLGTDGTVTQQGSHSNLITDRGLDVFATQQSWSDYYGSDSVYWQGWRTYLCVGTGATEPRTDQSELVAEVARSNESGGFIGSHTATKEGDYYIVRSTVVRVIDFNSSFNLTEYGLSEHPYSGVNIRELFRDSDDTPIVLTVNEGQQLKLKHTLTVKLSALPTDVMVNILGVGEVQTKAQIVASEGDNIYRLFSWVYSPPHAAYVSVADINDISDGVIQAIKEYNSASNEIYITGSHQIAKSVTFNTSEANRQIGGVIFASWDDKMTGYHVVFDTPLVKDDTKKLTLDFEISWSRGE